MTVKELIAHLKKWPAETVVALECPEASGYLLYFDMSVAIVAIEVERDYDSGIDTLVLCADTEYARKTLRREPATARTSHEEWA